MLADGFYTVLRQEDLPLGEFLAVIRLNPEHDIYKAHFPGEPITPGVCIVQIISEILGERLHREFALDEIVNLKFVSTLSPADDPLVEIGFTQVEETEGGCRAKGNSVVAGEPKTKFSLLLKNK